MTVMVDARELVDAGFRVVLATQTEGTFIATDAGAYHWGFSTGVSIAMPSTSLLITGFLGAWGKRKRTRVSSESKSLLGVDYYYHLWSRWDL